MTEPTINTAYLYDAEGRDHELALGEVSVDALEENQLLWIDAVRSDQTAEQARAILGVSEEAARLIRGPAVPARLDNFEGHFQFSLPMPDVKGADRARLDFLVGANWLMTVRDRDVPLFEQYRQQDRGESLKGKLSSSAIVSALFDWHLETFAAEIGFVDKAVDEVDEQVLAPRAPKPPLATLGRLRRRVAALRDMIEEHGPILRALLRPDFEPIADKPEADLFRGVEAHFNMVSNNVGKARETVIGSFELYATRTAQDTNDLVKALTVVTVIIGAAGAIAGIFGMNFDTAFAHWGTTGFVISVGVMALLAVMILVWARARAWL